MPFGLRNVGATYQRLVDKAFHKQIGRNLEVYVDDLVIKSHKEEGIIRDIEETFKTLREINMKLNLKNVPSGLPSPKCLKNVQKLNEKLATLKRFLAKLAEKSLPFFKTLKKYTKKSDFHWTKEAEDAFKQMKQLIAKIPTLTAPEEKEELIVYLAAAKEAISAVLMTEKEARKMPIYFVSRALRDESGAGLILTNPEGVEFTYALRFRFEATNNEAECEALIAGLRIARNGCKEPSEVLAVVEEEGNTWMTPIYKYLTEETLPVEVNKARAVRRHSKQITSYDRYMKVLVVCTQAHRTMIKSSNGDTPFSLTYGTEAVIPAEIGMPTLRTAEVDMVRSTSFKEGDLVYRNNDESRMEEVGNLGPKWEGLYEITEALGKGAYKLRDRDGKQLPRT
ncbi:reverse transcriptase domain-containing protein [Tanacetum coccineum]